MFLRNVGWLSVDYMTFYPRRQNSSTILIFILLGKRREDKRLWTEPFKVWITGWTTKEQGFDSWEKQEIFRFSIAFRPALEPTQPPIQYVPGGYTGWSVKLATHLQVVPRLRMVEGYLHYSIHHQDIVLNFKTSMVTIMPRVYSALNLFSNINFIFCCGSKYCKCDMFWRVYLCPPCLNFILLWLF
jgi:hypothetical protein